MPIKVHVSLNNNLYLHSQISYETNVRLLGFKNRVYFFLAVIAGLLLLIYAVIHQKNQRTQPSFMGALSTRITLPIEQAVRQFIHKIQNTKNTYITLTNASQENQQLKEQLIAQKRQLSQMQEVLRENQRLLNLLALKHRAQLMHLVPAHVIQHSPSPLFHSIRIDVGESSGIDKGMAVVSASSVVGRIMNVAAHHADVILFSDPTSSIDVTIARSRSRGRLKGLARFDRYEAKIDYLTRSTSVELGDEVLTTGSGSVFPKGFHIGYISQINRLVQGLYQEVIVSPSVPLMHLEEVLVVTQFEQEKAFVISQSMINAYQSDPFYFLFPREKELYPEQFPDLLH